MAGRANVVEANKRRAINEAENVYGRLTVIIRDGYKNNRIAWKCRCLCGNYITVMGKSLRNGDTKSCGCLLKETSSQRMKEFHKSKPFKGDGHPRWNPNLSEQDRIDRRTKEHDAWRELVFKRDNYTCVCCGDTTGGKLEAHHKKSYKDYPKLRYDVANGATVCKCHKEFHKIFGYTDFTSGQFWAFVIHKQNIN
jgi:hypothetical protein